MINKIKEIMSSVFKVDTHSINDQTTIETLENWDSLTHLNLIMSLEESFDVTIEDTEMAEMISYDIVTRVIKNKLEG